MYSTDLSIVVTCSDTAKSATILREGPVVTVGADVIEVKDGWLVCPHGELNSGRARPASWAALVCCHHSELRNENKTQDGQAIQMFSKSRSGTKWPTGAASLMLIYLLSC